MAFPSRVLTSALADAGLAGQDRPEAPFDRAVTGASGTLYAAQRRMFAAAAQGGAEPRDIEERALGVLDILVSDHLAARATRAGLLLDRVEYARRLVALEGPVPMPLTRLAAACEMSPYRLCRDFKRATGMTISAYRTQVRVFAALDQLPHARDLSALALAAGFCSHSHFTAAFRSVFGMTPSAMRRQLAG
jgi:AraC-like DNA-binding protein